MINLKPTNLELFLPSGKKIKYLLKRRNRRTIGLKVDHDGLVIHAPILIPRSRIEELIAPKLDWIQEKLSLQLSKRLASPLICPIISCLASSSTSISGAI